MYNLRPDILDLVEGRARRDSFAPLALRTLRL